MPDGGRDLVVREGSWNPNSLIPAQPSIWSAKAGADGKKPSTLQGEIDSHEKVIKHLESGGFFRYAVLQQCSQEERDNLTEKATSICHARELAEGAVTVVFNNNLSTCVARSPSLIPQHMPMLALRLGTAACSVDRWIADCRSGSFEYQPIQQRNNLADRIALLLEGDPDVRFIHVAGWSGVGKSRLVAEVVDASRRRDLVVVYKTWEGFCGGLLTSIESGQVTAGTIIVDEVDVSDIGRLAKLCEMRSGLRLVSIGATEQSRLPRYCEFIERPSVDEIIALVLREAHSSLEDTVVRRIAALSQGDVRFAQMLVAAARDLAADDSTPGALIEALRDLRTVVPRYFELHADILGDVAMFRATYSTLTLLSEVGVEDVGAAELKMLAAYCTQNETALHSAIDKAIRIGVCQRVGQFAECIPRPLATFVFEEDGWPQVSLRLLEFFEALPSERARRSFLRRVHYCSTERRSEVEQKLGTMFRSRYANARLGALADPEVAKTLRVLVEAVPCEGLAWLREIIEASSEDELLAFPGSTTAFGPTYGRREIVWLCEHLRAFADCFEHAEATLFRLAQAETENIANNATAEWRQCFWWRLSGTEVPLGRRIELLLRRLGRATPESIELLLSGVVAALHDPMAATAPPEFVGGRMTPPEWQASGWTELHDLWDRVVNAAIDLARQDGAIGDATICTIVGNLELFVRRGVPRGLVQLMDPARLPGDVLRSLRLALDRLIARENHFADGTQRDLATWRGSLVPSTTEEMIQEVVGREAWEHDRTIDDPESWRAPYSELAARLVSEPEVLADSASWLESDESRSPFALGSAIARDHAASEALRPQMLQWLNDGRAVGVVSGFLTAIASDAGTVPEWIQKALDSLMERRPDDAVRLTVEADISQSGFERLARALPRCTAPPSSLLSRLFGAQWEAVLTPADQIVVLQVLLAATDDEYALPCALHLLTMWYHRKENAIPEELDEIVGHLVRTTTTEQNIKRAHEWEVAARWWAQRHPDESARLMVQLITSDAAMRYGLSDHAETILRGLATHEPDAVAEAIEDALQNEGPSRLAFHIGVFRGLFERLGQDRVKQIIGRLGEDAAAAIARHLPDPDSIDAPDLIDWFLSEYGDNERVFRAYLCGRHSGKVVSGYAFDRRPGVYERTEPYIDHGNTGYRKWAQWERDMIDQDAERHQRMVDEMGRH